MPILTMPNELSSDESARADKLDENFAAIETVVNALDDDNIAGGAGIDPTKIGNGGAVCQDETTIAGEAGKIPRFTMTNGHIVCSRIHFMEDSDT